MLLVSTMSEMLRSASTIPALTVLCPVSTRTLFRVSSNGAQPTILESAQADRQPRSICRDTLSSDFKGICSDLGELMGLKVRNGQAAACATNRQLPTDFT